MRRAVRAGSPRLPALYRRVAARKPPPCKLASDDRAAPSDSTQEAVMGQPIPAQHPSVVLRSHFKLVKGLLAIAMVAVIALTAAVVILANDEDQVSGQHGLRPVDEPISRRLTARRRPRRGARGATASADPRHPLRRRPRRGHPRSRSRSRRRPPAPASTAAPRRAPAARRRTTSARLEVQLSAGAAADQLQGARRRPADDPAGSRQPVGVPPSSQRRRTGPLRRARLAVQASTGSAARPSSATRSRCSLAEP